MEHKDIILLVYEVMTALTLHEVRERLAEQEPGIILLDCAGHRQ